jgi:hypothetical protein
MLVLRIWVWLLALWKTCKPLARSMQAQYLIIIIIVIYLVFQISTRVEIELVNRLQ